MSHHSKHNIKSDKHDNETAVCRILNTFLHRLLPIIAHGEGVWLSDVKVPCGKAVSKVFDKFVAIGTLIGDKDGDVLADFGDPCLKFRLGE